MKRVFQERARLVVYLEQEHLAKITEMARQDGQTVVELIREMVGSLIESEEIQKVASNRENGGKDKNPRVQDVPRPAKVHPTGRRESNSGRIPGDCQCSHARRFHFNGESCKQCSCQRFIEGAEVED